ncbi:MAG: hypothetical protein RL675_752, partial [Bacteroidota bacterium]
MENAARRDNGSFPTSRKQAFQFASSYVPADNRRSDRSNSVVYSTSSSSNTSNKNQKNSNSTSRNGNDINIDNSSSSSFSPNNNHHDRNVNNNNNSNGNKRKFDNRRKFDNKRKFDDKRQVKCFICKKDHRAENCPDSERFREFRANIRSVSSLNDLSSNDNETYKVNGINNDSDRIALDSVADIHLFSNPNLVTNIRECRPIRVTGITADTMYVNQMADYGEFTDIYFSEKASGNVLSLAILSDIYDIHFNKISNLFVISTPNDEYIFNRIGNHYLMNATNVSTVNLTTSNLIPLNVKQKTKAYDAGERMAALGYPGVAAMTNLLDNGGVLNCDTTSYDIRNFRKVYGAHPEEFQGKFTRNPSIYLRNEKNESYKPDIKFIDLHTDIMFIGAIGYVISVSEPIGMTVEIPLVSKNVDSLTDALREHVSVFTQKGICVNKIIIDSEPAGIAIKKQRLIGMTDIMPLPHGKKNGIVERKIRTIKERIRTILSSIPYKFPKPLLDDLVRFVVIRINQLPNEGSGNRISPKELFTGNKLDFKRDKSLDVRFGSYCHVETANNDNKINNVHLPRTHGAIYLGPTENDAGDCLFYVLNFGNEFNRNKVDRKHIISRHKFAKLRMSEEIIDLINNLTDDKIDASECDQTNAHGYNEEKINADECDVNDVDESNIQSSIEINSNDDVNSNNDDDNDSEYIEEELDDHDNSYVSDDESNDGTTVKAKSPHIVKRLKTNKAKVKSLQAVESRCVQNTCHASGHHDPKMKNKVSAKYVIPEMLISKTSVMSEMSNCNINGCYDEHGIGCDKNEDERRSNICDSECDAYDNENHVYNLTVDDAMIKHGAKAEEGIVNELKSLIEKNVFEFNANNESRRNLRGKTVTSKLFLKEKLNEDGSLNKVKGRLVARGFSQGDVTNAYSPTVSHEIFCATLVNQARAGSRVSVIDVSTAYLNAEIDEELNIKINKDISDIMIKHNLVNPNALNKDGTIHAKLKKALYGLKQSGRLWYELLSKTLMELKFKPNLFKLIEMVRLFNNF